MKDVQAEKVDEWLKNLPNITDGYKQKDFYKTGKSGLSYHFMLAKTLVFNDDICNSGKNNKNCLTVSFCSNSDDSDKRSL